MILGPERCRHINIRGYGQCKLREGHEPYYNGSGVYYSHAYLKHPNTSMGTLDVYEALPPASDIDIAQLNQWLSQFSDGTRLRIPSKDGTRTVEIMIVKNILW